MKAEDTVIGCSSIPCNSTCHEIQAELSFKAGQESIGEPWDREGTVFEDGKKAGIKEVVEWIELNKFHIDGFPCYNSQGWQSKLKEWGIE